MPVPRAYEAASTLKRGYHERSSAFSLACTSDTANFWTWATGCSPGARSGSDSHSAGGSSSFPGTIEICEGGRPSTCESAACPTSTDCSAWISCVCARASSAFVRDASAPGRNSFFTSASTTTERTRARSTPAAAAVTVCRAARIVRYASAAAATACSRVTATRAPARSRAACAAATLAFRRPKSKGSHCTSAPTALPHTLSSEFVPSTGPVIVGYKPGCGTMIPKILLWVARSTWPPMSARGRNAVRARLTAAAAAATCSREARTAGYLADASCTTCSKVICANDALSGRSSAMIRNRVRGMAMNVSYPTARQSKGGTLSSVGLARLLRGLAGRQFHQEGGDAGPLLSLPMFDLVGSCGAIGANTPIGGRRGRPLQRERLGAGLFNRPGVAAVCRLVQLITVFIAPRAAIHNQHPAVFARKGKLLDRSEPVFTAFAEHRALPPAFAAICGNQQEWIPLQRKQYLAAHPSVFGVQKLNVVQSRPQDVAVHLPPGVSGIVARQHN